ncbi:TonB family protein [Verrucomicrobiales bacterium BCK34]|nr:TonB family protein [Verrucomicrobiales bacterium BCK34]
MNKALHIAGHPVLRILLALIATVGLLMFLSVIRLYKSEPTQTLSLRTLNTMPPASLPAPPPPPVEQPPPPPEMKELPKLNIELDSVAPPIKATLDRDVELRLETTDFAPQQDQPQERMTFSSSELDSSPRLVSRPRVSFPAAQRKRGVTEGRVTLEVLINTSGKVNVRRVLDSSHNDFTAMARTFASNSRFTPPRKNGRAVNALFKWPLILRP